MTTLPAAVVNMLGVQIVDALQRHGGGRHWQLHVQRVQFELPPSHSRSTFAEQRGDGELISLKAQQLGLNVLHQLMPSIVVLDLMLSLRGTAAEIASPSNL